MIFQRKSPWAESWMGVETNHIRKGLVCSPHYPSDLSWAISSSPTQCQSHCLASAILCTCWPCYLCNPSAVFHHLPPQPAPSYISSPFSGKSIFHSTISCSNPSFNSALSGSIILFYFPCKTSLFHIICNLFKYNAYCVLIDSSARTEALLMAAIFVCLGSWCIPNPMDRYIMVIPKMFIGWTDGFIDCWRKACVWGT